MPKRRSPAKKPKPAPKRKPKAAARAKAKPAPKRKPKPAPKRTRPAARKQPRKRRTDGPSIRISMSDVVIAEVEAEAALEAGLHDDAIAAYTRLIETASSPLASHLVGRGRAHYQTGNYELAIADFERGLAIEPHFPDLYFDKGKAELQAGRAGDADASFTRDLESGEPSPITLYNRHLARKALGDLDAALDDLDAAIDSGAGMPDSIPLRVARATLRAQLADLEGAYHDAIYAAKLDPDDASLHERCARLAFGLGALERAADSFARAQHLTLASGQPANPDWYAGQALAIGQLGRTHEAIELFGKALQLRPDDPTFYCNRGWLFHLVGRHADALADLDRALQLDPSYGKALQNRNAVLEAIARSS